MGLSVDHISADGAMIKVSGNAAQLAAAFGTELHQLQADGRTFYKATSVPKYQGANAELVTAVSGLTGPGARPFIAYQTDLSTGARVAPLSAQAGTDPLASFTANCFGPVTTVMMSGFGARVGPGGVVAGGVQTTMTGPTYLDITKTVAQQPTCGMTAKQVVSHYGLDEAHALGWTGKGETIVIIDAFGSPTALADLNTFSTVMGLPAMDANSFQVVYSDGLPASTDLGWATETTLDIEWAHALAPDAKIVLLVAPSPDNAELTNAIQYATTNRLGSVISASWGLPEVDSDASTAQMFNQAITRAAARGISVHVATGDSGDNHVGTPVGAPALPSDSPFATAIGGTSIGVPSDRGPVEAGWGVALTQLGRKISPFPVPQVFGTIQGSGGGESVFFEKPHFEHKLPGTGRQVPDVSALADPQMGAIIVQTNPRTGQPVYFVIGGTSLAAPLFSAIWTLADQAAREPLGQAAPIIAKLPPFAIRDILPIEAEEANTSGSILFRGTQLTNYTPAQLLGVDVTQPDGFVGTLILAGRVPFTGYSVIGFGIDTSLQTTEGWDNVTGWGVPNGLSFIESARHFARGK
jgi:subtilase family serine protease